MSLVRRFFLVFFLVGGVVKGAADNNNNLPHSPSSEDLAASPIASVAQKEVAAPSARGDKVSFLLIDLYMWYQNGRFVQSCYDTLPKEGANIALGAGVVVQLLYVLGGSNWKDISALVLFLKGAVFFIEASDLYTGSTTFFGACGAYALFESFFNFLCACVVFSWKYYVTICFEEFLIGCGEAIQEESKKHSNLFVRQGGEKFCGWLTAHVRENKDAHDANYQQWLLKLVLHIFVVPFCIRGLGMLWMRWNVSQWVWERWELAKQRWLFFWKGRMKDSLYHA